LADVERGGRLLGTDGPARARARTGGARSGDQRVGVAAVVRAGGDARAHRRRERSQRLDQPLRHARLGPTPVDAAGARPPPPPPPPSPGRRAAAPPPPPPTPPPPRSWPPPASSASTARPRSNCCARWTSSARRRRRSRSSTGGGGASAAGVAWNTSAVSPSDTM